MAKQVWVDQDECISCGVCIDNLPGAFRFAENGKAECFDSSAATEAEIESKAIDVCPVLCIHWRW